MTKKIKQYSERIIQLIELADGTLATKQTSSKGLSTWVNSELFFEFRTSSLSFILNLYGDNHPFYKEFDKIVVRADPYNTEHGRGILKSIRTEIDNGWLNSLKGLISAEIFSDFLEMADHLLKEN